MAVIIEEGSEESQVPVVETEDTNEVAQEATVVEDVQDDSEALPDKYKGKSAKEIAQMHMEAERLIGRQGSEVGELRRIVDDYTNVNDDVLVTGTVSPTGKFLTKYTTSWFDDKKQTAEAMADFFKVSRTSAHYMIRDLKHKIRKIQYCYERI